MKTNRYIKYLKKRAFKLERSILRKVKAVIFKSKPSKSAKKYLKMEAGVATFKLLKLLIFQIKLRPRLRLAFKATLVLSLLYFISMPVTTALAERRQEIKINGQAVLVAEANKAEIKPEEISTLISSKLSPFVYINPVQDGLISQKFSSYHRALDIATSFGAEIKPIGAGSVEFAGFIPDGHGNTVVIDHGDNLKTVYAHMGEIKVGVGNIVGPDTIIGTVGLTGRTTGPHLHLEVYDRDVAMNPESVLP